MSLIDFVFPVKCPFCFKISDKKYLKKNGMCQKCFDTIDRYEHADSVPSESTDNVLNLFCPLRYTGAVKKAIISYKFNGQLWMAEYFSLIMHRFLENNGGYDYCDYICFVPVSRKRFMERGYDQSGEIAKRLSVLSGISLIDVLKRDDSLKSSGSGYTSKMNLEQRMSEKRFILKDGSEVPEGAAVLLIDDILTTGSTLKECSGILLEAGAGSVSACVIASGRRDILPDASYEKEA